MHVIMTRLTHVGGSLHCFYEGYFIYNHDRMPAMQDVFGQLWKEYAKSDSRYLAADSLVLTLETITVVGVLSSVSSLSLLTSSFSVRLGTVILYDSMVHCVRISLQISIPGSGIDRTPV